MMPINASAAEEAVIEIPKRTGPCCIDDLVMQLPAHTWSEVFLAVDRMSRCSRLLLRRLASSAYHVSLPSRHASPRSSSRQKEVQA
jgi:hypothetical protein